MTRRRAVLLAFVLVAAVACYAAVRRPPARRPPRREWPVATKTDLAIYSAIIAGKVAERGRTCVVVSDTESGSDVTDEVSRAIGSFKKRKADVKALMADFRKCNARSVSIPKFKAACPLVFVTRKRLDDIFRLGFWAAFYRMFPNPAGYVEFSLPGYSRDRSAAVVYFVHVWGGRAGYVELLYLKRSDSEWRIDAEEGVLQI